MNAELKRFEDLHRQLKEFYGQTASYFAEAHSINSEITSERAHILSWIQPNSRVLDVGCGPGDNSLYLGNSARYVGCDMSGVALRMAQQAQPAGAFCLGESQQLPFAEASFDAVLSTYALEHFAFPKESLEEMWRVCRPGGRILLISPAYDDPRALPPSTSHWSWPRRAFLVFAQGWRQIRRHLSRNRFYFYCLTQPRVLSGVYESDFDAVHLVSAREISNFFRSMDGNILFERKRTPRAIVGGTVLKRLVEGARNLLLRLHIGEYSGLNLQIAVEKASSTEP